MHFKTSTHNIIQLHAKFKGESQNVSFSTLLDCYRELLLSIFKESRARHYRGLVQCELWKRLVKCKHIFFTSVGLKFPLWWVTWNSKHYPEEGNLEWKSYPNGWEVCFWSKYQPYPVVAPPPTPPPPLGYKIDSCITRLLNFWLSFCLAFGAALRMEW